MPLLAELPYPLIDPIIVHIGDQGVRWYGVSYIVAFLLAGWVLHGLARRGLWPVPAERVMDVLFWGILGVFVGGRVGYVLFYGLSLGYDLPQALRVWDGGMSFHGGLLGVVIAYLLYARKKGISKGQLFDGLALATAPGLGVVRLGNFVNAELYGRVTDAGIGMRFPRYEGGPWSGPNGWWQIYESGAPEPYGFWTEPRHPSQLYEAFAEGLVLFLLLRWLLVRRGVGGGRIAASFLMGYGVLRFGIEFFREPDVGIPLLGFITRGQQLCLGMVAVGAYMFWRTRATATGGGGAALKSQEPKGAGR